MRVCEKWNASTRQVEFEYATRLKCDVTLELYRKIPSQKHFVEQEIPRLYNTIKETTVMPKLKEIEYFSATTNFWTSQANHPYLSYTIHFVDKQWNPWNLITFCLETIPLFEDHSGENLVEAISDIYTCELEIVIGYSSCYHTTDIGSNFVTSFHTKG